MLTKRSQRKKYACYIAIGFAFCFVAPALFRFSPACYPRSKDATVERAHEANAKQGEANQAITFLVRSEEEQTNAAYGSETEHEEPTEKPVETPWYCDIRVGDMALAFFTACLVIVGWATVQSSELIAARNLAISRRQIRISDLQTNILDKQKEISTLQYFAEHRPRLVLKDVFFSSIDNRHEVTFELANIGGSDAKITGGFVAFTSVTDDRQFKSADQGDINGLEGIVFPAGKLTQFKRRSPPDLGFFLMYPGAAQIGFVDEPKKPPEKPYFFGTLIYSDGRGEEFGTVRLSVFRREFDATTASFRRTGNPDHEYAD